MGLHPRGIEAMLFIILDLLWRGYRVCLSTHSPHVLDLVWALRNLRQQHADPKQVVRIFGLKKSSPALVQLGRAAVNASAKVYYFDNKSGQARDISNLDPAADEAMESEWGGLTELSRRVEDIVAEAVAAHGRRG
jgi:hypothetical protein